MSDVDCCTVDGFPFIRTCQISSARWGEADAKKFWEGRFAGQNHPSFSPMLNDSVNVLTCGVLAQCDTVRDSGFVAYGLGYLATLIASTLSHPVWVRRFRLRRSKSVSALIDTGTGTCGILCAVSRKSITNN